VNGIKSGEVREISEQHHVDCCDSIGCGGCNGGDMRFLVDWLKDSGTYTLTDYPYTSGTSGVEGTCTTTGLTAIDPTEVVVSKTNWVTK